MHTYVTHRFLAFSATCMAVASVLLALPAYAACNPSALGRTAYGTSGVSVSTLQSCLIDAGYSIPAGPTGYYGGQTRAAVQQFYRDHLGLPTWDGLSVGPQGRAKLAALRGGSVGSDTSTGGTPAGYKRAANAAELSNYIAEAGKQGGGMGVMRSGVVPPMAAPQAQDSASEGNSAGRVSDTNVQVAGIDEPDIVKTDGENLFISREGWYFGGGIRPLPAVGGGPALMDAMMPRLWEDTSTTKVVDAFPPVDLAIVGEIKEKGEMLLVRDKKMLVVFSYPSIVGYSVADPKNPVKKWTLSLENNSSVVTSRLSDGTLYLVTQTWLDQSIPCPVVPLLRGSDKISIPCGSIWIPNRIEPVTHTFTLLALDPETGTSKQTTSFAAQGDVTTVSVFKDNLYLVTKSYTAPYTVLADITVSSYAPHLSAAAREKVNTIRGYDISPAGKMNEIQQVIQGDFALMEANARLKLETDIQDTIQKALDQRKRELDRTRITRVALGTLSVAAVGEVPGSLLNQFSLDEYEGSVRVAVTVGSNWWGGGAESANDVYVLGLDLKEKGSIRDLGLGERVFAARFIGPVGYLVTFRQIDPFYTLDLSNPNAPRKVGELKIPGYSAYLEPLEGNMVLGVGREGNGVKLSLFDVSNPAQPTEKSKYLIKDEWSEVEGNHRAFLSDGEHDVFFVPGSQGGYVFSYEGGKLALKATVSGYNVKRAVYLDDYFYVIGDEKVTVFDEATWKELKTLSLN